MQSDKYLEKWRTPEIPLRVSIEVSEALIHMIENFNKTKITFDNPAHCVNIMNEHELLRVMAEKLKLVCVDWHKKNPLPMGGLDEH
jgi:hypothetical protein